MACMSRAALRRRVPRAVHLAFFATVLLRDYFSPVYTEQHLFVVSDRGRFDGKYVRGFQDAQNRDSRNTRAHDGKPQRLVVYVDARERPNTEEVARAC